MIVRFLCKLQNKSDACSRGCSVFILILRQKAASNAQIHIKSINMFRFQGFTFRHPCAMMYVVEDGANLVLLHFSAKKRQNLGRKQDFRDPL